VKINGFELKSVKEFSGHEGERCYRGNIFFNGKKVGTFESSYTMGPMDVRFNSDEVAVEFEKTLRAFINNNPYGFLNEHKDFGSLVHIYDKELFILDMIGLKDVEKQYKKACKEGYTIMTVSTNGMMRTFLPVHNAVSVIGCHLAKEGECPLHFIKSAEFFNIKL
jgi:hypothetical protein